MYNLSDLNVGESGIIKSFNDDLIGSKLISMGLYPEKKATVIDTKHNKYAFFIVIGSLKIALLKHEAQSVNIQKI